MRLCFSVCLLAVSILVLGAQSISADPPRGWHVLVCNLRQPPLELRLSFPKDPNLKIWRNWNHGEANPFLLPIEYRYAAEIKLWAYGQNKQVDLCVGYNNHGIKKMSFNRTEQHDLSLENRNACTC